MTYSLLYGAHSEGIIYKMTTTTQYGKSWGPENLGALLIHGHKHIHYSPHGQSRPPLGRLTSTNRSQLIEDCYRHKEIDMFGRAEVRGDIRKLRVQSAG